MKTGVMFEYALVALLAWVFETMAWQSNEIAKIGYIGNVVMFAVLFMAAYHIGRLRGLTNETGGQEGGK